MLWHAIAPSYGYTKAANHLLRHPRLNSDAKVLLLHVQSLPPGQQTEQALSEHARALRITGRAYQQAKKLLVMNGFVHEWREQGLRGFWTTEQLFTNVALTREEASGVRAEQAAAATETQPSVRKPTVGQPGARTVGGYEPVDKERDKNSSHQPTAPQPDPQPLPEPEPDTDAVPAEVVPEAAEAERVLLSLRHSHRSLHLGVPEARKLVEPAATWLRRGFTAAEMRRVLVSDLPPGGVRSAVGFLRHRLVQKLPEPPGVPLVAACASPPVDEPAPPVVAPLVTCAGPGDEHVFRRVDGETHCAPCRQDVAWERWSERRTVDLAAEDPYHHTPWREKVAGFVEQRRLAEAGP
jgi:hypothetical protein